MNLAISYVAYRIRDHELIMRVYPHVSLAKTDYLHCIRLCSSENSPFLTPAKVALLTGRSRAFSDMLDANQIDREVGLAFQYTFKTGDDARRAINGLCLLAAFYRSRLLTIDWPTVRKDDGEWERVLNTAERLRSRLDGN